MTLGGILEKALKTPVNVTRAVDRPINNPRLCSQLSKGMKVKIAKNSHKYTVANSRNCTRGELPSFPLPAQNGIYSHLTEWIIVIIISAAVCDSLTGISMQL